MIHSSGSGDWSSPPRIVQELRIGRVEGDDNYLFGDIAALAVGRDGTLYVADSHGPRIRAYDATGRFLRQIGRPGGGPGEYRMITGMAITPSGELAVFDTSQRRITLYSSDGELARTIDSTVGGSWRGNDFHVDRAGNFYVYGLRVSQDPMARPLPGQEMPVDVAGVLEPVFVKLSPGGEVIDTLPAPRSARPRVPGFAVQTGATSPRSTSSRLTGHSSAASSPRRTPASCCATVVSSGVCRLASWTRATWCATDLNPPDEMRFLNCRLLLALTALVIAASACRQADAGTETQLESLTSLRAEEELRIGDRDDPQRGFSRVSRVEVDEDGNLYVLEFSVPEIRVYTPEGELLRRFGRRGDGPGEFQSVSAFGVHRDTLWVLDSRHRRITLFDAQGPLLSTSPLEEASIQLTNGRAFTWPQITRDDGTLMGQLSMLQYAGGDPSLVDGPDQLIPVPLVRFDLAGEVVDTIGWASRPPPGLWRPLSEERPMQEMISIGGRNFGVPRPPDNLPLYLMLADGYVIGQRPMPTDENGTLAITRFAANGDTVYARRLRYRAPPYTPDDLDRIAAGATRGEGLEFYRVGASPPPVENPEAVTNRLRAAMAYPEFQMPITTALGGADGSVWLAFRSAMESTTTWALLAPDGTPRGTTTLPAGVTILWHSGDIFYAAVPDELDVPWVVRYRLVPER